MTGRGSLLLVAPAIPAPDTYAGHARFHAIIKMLARHHELTLVTRAWDTPRPTHEYVRDLEAAGVRVLLRPQLEVWDLLDGTTAGVWFEFYGIADDGIDAVRLTRPMLPIIVDTVDLHFLRELRGADYAPDPRAAREQARRTRRRELRAYRHADVVIAATEADRQALVPYLPKTRLIVLPTVHHVPESLGAAPSRTPRSLLFVGGFGHPPNVDAVTFLCDDVLPLVRREVPDVTLTVIGTAPPPAIQARDGRGIRVAGWVPEVEPFLRSHWMSVAPLRFGAGMKGKVAEAMAAGLPVVTTTIGAEGLGLQDRVHALIADTAEGLAAAIVDLCTDPALHARLAENALIHARARWSHEAVERDVAALVAELERIEPQRITLARRAGSRMRPVRDRWDRLRSIVTWYVHRFRIRRPSGQ